MNLVRCETCHAETDYETARMLWMELHYEVSRLDVFPGPLHFDSWECLAVHAIEKARPADLEPEPPAAEPEPVPALRLAPRRTKRSFLSPRARLA